MKTRPHIVTQTCVLPTAGLYRCADGLAARIKRAGDGGQEREMHRFSALVIRVMTIILDVTLHNNCFVRRREVLASPRLRAGVAEQLGGAPALEKWRRKNTWNTARLAAIASGAYKPPAPGYAAPIVRRGGAGLNADARFKSPAVRPSSFRLPVLKNLRHRARPVLTVGTRAAPQKRFPAIVVWPHELDGQYVPGFTSAASRPQNHPALYAPWPVPGGGVAAGIAGAPP